jgi:hypothetical protein
MRAIIIQDAELNSLRASILDRSTLLPAITKAAPNVSTEDRDAIVTALERRIGFVVAEWILEVSR